MPYSRAHTQESKSVVPNHRATRKRVSSYSLLNGPHRSVGVCIPNSRGHTKAWGTNPRLKGPHRSVALPIPDARDHTQPRESVSPTPGAAPKRRSPYRQVKVSHGSVRVGIRCSSKGRPKVWDLGIATQQRAALKHGSRYPDLKGWAKEWKFVSLTQWTTPKHGIPFAQLKEAHRSVAVGILYSRGRIEVWESLSATKGTTPKHDNLYPQRKGAH